MLSCLCHRSATAGAHPKGAGAAATRAPEAAGAAEAGHGGAAQQPQQQPAPGPVCASCRLFPGAGFARSLPHASASPGGCWRPAAAVAFRAVPRPSQPGPAAVAPPSHRVAPHRTPDRALPRWLPAAQAGCRGRASRERERALGGGPLRLCWLGPVTVRVWRPSSACRTVVYLTSCTCHLLACAAPQSATSIRSAGWLASASLCRPGAPARRLLYS